MPVYRLTPLEETVDNPQWRASSMRPQCLWIKARDEAEARQAVARATCSAADGLPPPWNETALVACAYDDDADVPSGIIRVRRGYVDFCPNTATQRLN